MLGTALGAAVLLGCSAVDSVTGDGGGSPTPAPNGVADKPPAEILTAAQVDTVGVTFTSDEGKATVYVATTGKPYPMYLSTTGKTADETSTLDFLEYDQPLEVKAPPPDLVVDLSKVGN